MGGLPSSRVLTCVLLACNVPAAAGLAHDWMEAALSICKLLTLSLLHL